MKEHHHIDELIRKKFEDFEPIPPGSVWDKVKTGIGPGTTPPRGGISLPIITGLIVLVGLVSLMWLTSKMESAVTSPTDYTLTLSDNISNFTSTAEDKLLATATYMSTDRNGQLNQENAADRILTTSIPLRKPFEGSSPSAYDLRKQPAHEARSQYIKRNSRSHTNQPEHCASDPWRIEGKDFTGSLQIPGKTFSFNQREDWHSGKEEDYVKASQPIWSLGLYFNPDITFYPSDNLSNGLNYSLQVLPKLCFNQWYLQSGIGLRTGGDRGDLHINYNKYLGSYEDVYEVTFDSTANGVIPTYHTQAVDVYDTLPYYSVAESKVSFAYLDMPLLVGREWKLNKVSFYLHAGPAFSVLLGRSSPQPDYPEENIRILNESPQIPAREQFNWQIVAGAGLNYSLDEKISLSLEPTFRYYLTQDYDKHSLNTRHPYSFGVRAGLIYRINH